MDIKKIEEASKKVGGYYKLTVLLQKRVKELVSGSAPLIDAKIENPIEIALEEVLEGKIRLEPKQGI
ncbi:MAG: DNA-directed RNA polymerase subunit omega [Planctomycetota bacterium]